MSLPRIVRFAASLFSLGCIPGVVGAWEPPARFSPEQVQYFEAKVRPLLIEHCYSCHGPEKQKGDLRLDSRAAILAGGESGPGLIPGKPDDSLLIQAVQYKGLEMPPKRKLPPEKIQILTTWVKSGAPWPGSDKEDSKSEKEITKSHRKGNEPVITEADRAYWAFQPVRRPPVPGSANIGKHPIDAFVESRLAREGIRANGPAQPRELVRRLFFDLNGLPPSFGELETWTARITRNPDHPGGINESAYLELIEVLMSRPAYGEHWGRHWLDVVRFAQSNGYERDGPKPNAWRYRDYVVNSLQKDKPYNRFVQEQIAGDELEDATSETRIATGFYRMGVWDDEPDDKRQAEFDEIDDILVTVGASFVGLTLGCARCHDHKFDPIPQTDYYRLVAFLRNIKPYGNPEPTLENETFVPINEDAEVRRAVEALKARKARREAAIASARTEKEKKQIQAGRIDESLVGLDWALGVRERNEKLPTHVLIRGNAATPGPEVTPGFPQVLVSGKYREPLDISPARSPLGDLFPTTGKRLVLAGWLSSRDNPLTARVMVNRLWHYHFGRGIVATTGDFGKAGSPPTHPDLLDWLASEFMDKGWSIKQMHRTILTSQAYRRSSRVNQDSVARIALNKDPGNTLLWRQNLRRLDAEGIRDSLLATSGELNTKAGGPEMFPRLSGEVLAGQSKPGLDWEMSPPGDRLRRSLYAVVKRSVREPLLDSFDYANTTSPLTERPVTTVAPQALVLLNNRFIEERGAALALKVARAKDHPPDQVREIFKTVLQRPPTDQELALGLEFLRRAEENYLPLAGMVSFRPDVPVSLYSAFRQRISGEDCLLGPPSGWEYIRGSWGGGYEGIDVVDPRFGPYGLWNGADFMDGEIRGRLKFDAATQLVSLLARAVPDGDKWSGVGVTLDRAGNQLQLRQRFAGREEVTSVSLTLSPGEMVPFRMILQGKRFRFWIGDVFSDKPVIETSLKAESLVSGRMGVATWGGAVSLDRFEVISTNENGGTQVLDVARHGAPNPKRGPPPGWSVYGGDWNIRGDGSLGVRPEMGAKILWDKEPIRDGEVRVEMKFSKRAAGIGGLILRVSEPRIGADNWFGHEVSLDFSRGVVFLGDHRNNWMPLVDQTVSIRPDTWHKIRVVMKGKRIQVFVDNSPGPQIDREINPPLAGTLAGMRTWGSEIEYRNFEMIRDGITLKALWQPQDAGPEKPSRSDGQWARQKALEAFCRSVFNLNEFLYVD